MKIDESKGSYIGSIPLWTVQGAPGSETEGLVFGTFTSEAVAADAAGVLEDAGFETYVSCRGPALNELVLDGEPERFFDPSFGLRVPTSAGTIEASPCCDPGAPGIRVSLRPDGEDGSIDVAMACVYEDPDYRTEDDEGDDLAVFLWEDPGQDDYTRKSILRKDDVRRALK